MIYTVTFNPCLDYIVSASDFQTGEVNRADTEHLLPGGKGINVSIVLTNLGIDNTALGFTAGFTGREITDRLCSLGCKSDFISLSDGFSRINMKLRNMQNGRVLEETELNGRGPDITPSDICALEQRLALLTQEDILVLAGSIPASMPDTIYQQIMEQLKKKNVKIIVDATGDLLVNVLAYRPFLIKPNNHELGEIFGVSLQNKTEVIAYAKKLQDQGARNVLISMAGAGAVMVCENGQVYQSEAPKGKVVNSVGAGDSMVAGFIAGYLQGEDYFTAFLTGIAAGSASAFSENLAIKPEVHRILKTLRKF